MAYQIINPEMEAKFLVNLKKQETNILRWGEKKEVCIFWSDTNKSF